MTKSTPENQPHTMEYVSPELAEARQDISNYIYDGSPVDATSLTYLGSNKPMIGDIQQPFGEGPKTAEQAERVDKLYRFVGRISERDSKAITSVPTTSISSRGANTRGIVAADKDYRGSLGGGSPGNPLRIGKSS